MTHSSTLVLLVLLGLTVLPTADAQQQTALTLRVPSPDAPVGSGGAANVTAILTYTADASTMLNLGGVPVDYQVTRSPPWLQVVLSPSHDVIPTDSVPVGATMTSHRTFRIEMYGLANATTDVVADTVEVRATTQPGALLSRPQSVAAAIIVRAAPHACPTPAAAPSAGPTSSGGATDSAAAVPSGRTATPSVASAQTRSLALAPAPIPVQVQSATAPLTPVSWGAIAGFGIVGAGVGLAMWRRK